MQSGTSAQLALHPRMLLACVVTQVFMIPVGVFLAALGIFVLKLSGGAASDTSLVVTLAGFAVTDFWGAGIVTALTKASPRDVMIAWGLTRAAGVLILVAFAGRFLAIAPVEIILAVPIAWAGSRVARAQQRLRSEAVRELREGGDHESDVHAGQ